MERRGRPKHPDILTPREWEVLALIRESLSNEEIAERLGISIEGAKYHVSEILSKLGLENRWDAARWRPEAERPRWLAVGAPLLFWRRFSFGWLPPAVAGGMAVVVAAGAGLLVWALLNNGSNGSLTLPAGDKIAYVGTDGDLWVLESNGEARRLTERGGTSGPQWSPDGEWLLFFRGTTLWLADDEAGAPRQVDEGVVSAHWSPAPFNRIVYQRGSAEQVTGNDSLFYYAASGDRRSLLPVLVTDLASSPNGFEFAVAYFGSEDSPLWLLTSNGNTEFRRLFTIDELANLLGDGSQGLIRDRVTGITWSPDGEWIGFSATGNSASLAADGVPFFTIRRDGAGLTYHGVTLRSPTLHDWAPNGHTLAITLGGGRDVYLGKTVAIAEAGVPGARVIAEEPERLPTHENPIGQPLELSIRADAWPTVSDDATQIAFQASEASWETQPLDIGKVEGPREGIWAVNFDGSNPRQLTSDPDYLDFYPRWSADGEWIVFLRTDGKPFSESLTPVPDAQAEIWLMRPDGSEAIPLASNLIRIGSYYGLFAWDHYVAWYRAPAKP